MLVTLRTSNGFASAFHSTPAQIELGGRWRLKLSPKITHLPTRPRSELDSRFWLVRQTVLVDRCGAGFNDNWD